MNVYLIRHGQDDNTVRGGWSDFGLTAAGIEQAKSLGYSLSNGYNQYNIGKIISSDLKRAIQTAEIIADILSLDIETDNNLREVNNGDLSGMKNEIADELYPNLYWRNLEWEQKYPNGESPKEFFDRVHRAWNLLKDRFKNYDKNILIVTHGGVINVIKSIENSEKYSNKSKFCSVKPCENDYIIELQ